MPATFTNSSANIGTQNSFNTVFNPGTPITFNNIVNTTSVATGTTYYVVTASTSTLTISASPTLSPSYHYYDQRHGDRECHAGRDGEHWCLSLGAAVQHRQAAGCLYALSDNRDFQVVNDNISATGDLATALAASKTVVANVGSAQECDGLSGCAGTIIGNGGSAFLSKNSTDNLIAGSLATTTTGMWPNANTEQATLAFDSSGGAIGLNGSTATDATSRSLSSGTVYFGSTNGSSGLLTGDYVSLAVYSTKIAPTSTATQPITGVSWGGQPGAFPNYYGRYYSGSDYVNAIFNYNGTARSRDIVHRD